MMTLNEIKALIASGENESKYLEFKESRALPEKTNNHFREELSKDVSSFANSAGGKIIYGVAENPLRLDAFDRKLCSLERLQNLINSHIAPKIPGLQIYPIPVEDGKILYVVEIPQGKTAHQAADRKYYKRHEGTIEAMEDYEIRDVMARSSGIETKLLLASDLSRSRTKNETRETHRPGRHFQVSVINEGNK